MHRASKWHQVRREPARIRCRRADDREELPMGQVRTSRACRPRRVLARTRLGLQSCPRFLRPTRRTTRLVREAPGSSASSPSAYGMPEKAARMTSLIASMSLEHSRRTLIAVIAPPNGPGIELPAAREPTGTDRRGRVAYPGRRLGSPPPAPGWRPVNSSALLGSRRPRPTREPATDLSSVGVVLVAEYAVKVGLFVENHEKVEGRADEEPVENESTGLEQQRPT